MGKNRLYWISNKCVDTSFSKRWLLLFTLVHSYFSSVGWEERLPERVGRIKRYGKRGKSEYLQTPPQTRDQGQHKHEKTCWSYISWTGGDGWSFTFGLFLPKTYTPNLTMRKASDKPNRGTFYECPTSVSQNCQGHQNKESLKTCYGQEAPKETCHVESGKGQQKKDTG